MHGLQSLIILLTGLHGGVADRPASAAMRHGRHVPGQDHGRNCCNALAAGSNCIIMERPSVYVA